MNLSLGKGEEVPEEATEIFSNRHGTIASFLILSDDPRLTCEALFSMIERVLFCLW